LHVVFFDPEDGDKMLFRDIDYFSTDYTE
jgi:hypothetical protein